MAKLSGSRDWSCASALLFGIAVTFPVLVPGGSSVGLRLTDVLNATSIGAMIWVAVFGSIHRRYSVSLLVVAALSSFWIANELALSALRLGHGPVRMILVRWLLSLPTAYWLAVLASRPTSRTSLFTGMLIGLSLSLVSLVHDYCYFNEALLVPLPFGENESVYVNGAYRAQGIFYHPNAAAGTILLAVPLIIGLIQEYKLPAISILVAAAFTATVFFTTQTRGPSVICIAFIVWCLAKRSWAALALVLAIGLVLAIYLTGHQAEVNDVWSRLEDTTSGAEGRTKTMLASLSIALENPFGVGSIYESMLRKETGFNATHNAWTQLAMLAGWPLTTYVIVRVVLLLKNFKLVEGLLAAYVLSAFLFENQFFVPTYTIIVLWMVCTSPPDFMLAFGENSSIGNGCVASRRVGQSG